MAHSLADSGNDSITFDQTAVNRPAGSSVGKSLVRMVSTASPHFSSAWRSACLSSSSFVPKW
jgi:hypothetical protein